MKDSGNEAEKGYPFFNLLSPNSDQQQFSPNNVHTLSREGCENIKNDHERENVLKFY